MKKRLPVCLLLTLLVSPAVHTYAQVPTAPQPMPPTVVPSSVPILPSTKPGGPGLPGPGATGTPPAPGAPVVVPQSELPSAVEIFADQEFPEFAPFRGEGFPGKQHFHEVLDKFREMSLLGGLDHKKLLEWYGEWNTRYDKERHAEIETEEGSDKACLEALEDLHNRFTPVSVNVLPAGAAKPTAAAPPTAVAAEVELANDARLQELLMFQVRRFDRYMVPAKPDPNHKPSGNVGVGLAYHLWEEWKLKKAHEGMLWEEYQSKVQIVSVDHPFYINEVVEGGPAAAAGVTEESILLAIDAKPLNGMLLKDVQSMLAGAPGSTVELTVQATDKQGKPTIEKNFKVVRNGYHLPAVRFKDLGDNVAYLRIDAFTEAADGGPSVVAEFRAALEQIVKNGFRMVIFDVRNNPGGRVDFCLDMLEWVLPSGYMTTELERKDDGLQRSTVSLTRDMRLVTKPSKDKKSYEFDASGRELILPESTAVVVLTNGNTASCGEMFSLALKYNHRAETIGTRTYGKGITQAVIKVRDRELHITNAFFHPGDVFTNGIGGKPDLEVVRELSEQDNQLAAAIKRVKELNQANLDATAAREKEVSSAYSDNKAHWAPEPATKK
ncbi:hypothetical protein BH10CYA1_BH10CYA1_32060 [soil metagenome]